MAECQTRSSAEVGRRLLEIEKMLKKEPKNIRLMEKKIAGLHLLGRDSEASELCEQAMKFDGDSPIILYFMGYFRFKEEKWEDALHFLDKAFENGSIESLGLKSLCLRRMNKNNECIEFATKYLKRFPNMSELYFNRGMAMKNLKQDLRLVCSDLKRAAELNPAVRDTYVNTCLAGQRR
jgi:tetratricopeptide (TPR) repeat protein